MNKISLVISREYLTRVKKKSFLIMTFGVPLLFAVMMVVVGFVVQYGSKSETFKNIAISDNCNISKSEIKDVGTLRFKFPNAKIEDLKSEIGKEYFAVLDLANLDKYSLISDQQIPIDIKNTIKRLISRKLKNQKIIDLKLDKELLKQLDINVALSTIFINKQGVEEQSSSELITGISFALAFMIYMFIFIYGAQVMRGVIEEKSNRIVEVIISSIKPFELMLGKILGVALVALTQVLMWIALTIVILIVGAVIMTGGIDFTAIAASNPALASITSGFESLPIMPLLFGFLFYFTAGYLLYSSLFAAIGSAVDNETDTQQFMIPISLPLILAFVMAQVIIKNPETPLAFWGSMIPFTSPIIMLIRIPFGVEWWELVLSGTILVASFIFTTWLAGRIYRIGILMYGKKVTYGELLKWIRQKS